MRSLHEVQFKEFRCSVAVPSSGAGTATWPGRAGHPDDRRPRVTSALRDRYACDALRKMRAPLRQQGCSPLESHRGLKHEGIL